MFVTVNGIKLYYEQQGKGKPFLLLHGNSEDHTKFDQLASILSEDYTVYAIDSRCHGQSAKSEEIGYRAIMEDTVAFIQELGLLKPILLGASDGAIVGLLTAINQPDLLSGLISCGANTNPSQLRKWFLLLCKLGYLGTKDPRFKMMLTEPDISNSELSRIKIPTLVLAGTCDIISANTTKMIAASIPDSDIKILKRQTHSSYLEHCEVVMDAMKPFLNEIL